VLPRSTNWRATTARRSSCARQPSPHDDGFVGGLTIDAGGELAPNPVHLARELKRVDIRRPMDAMTDNELVQALADSSQGLVIVNSRAHALALYQAAKQSGRDGPAICGSGRANMDISREPGEVERRAG
jgi:hypothetical protein